MNDTGDTTAPQSNDDSEALDRDSAIEATRTRLDPSLEISDDEIWKAWQEVGGRGPTAGDDLGRVIAQLEGIAVDG